MREFGDRWMAEGEIENIRQWESKNTLDSTLSNNYGSCLEFFVQNELVYASSWTSYGNPREYTLFPSLQELLGQSQILCKRRNAVQIEQNLFKAEVAQAAAALFSK